MTDPTPCVASYRSYRKAIGPVRRLLLHEHLPIALAILSALLTLPSLSKGLVTDDLIHRAKLLTLPLPEVLRKLFIFVDRDNGAQLLDLGAGPWWSVKGLQIAFFRPVTALTHWLDYRLWPDSPALMHAHSVIWYGAVCALAALFYRRVMGHVWVAGLAAFLFAVDDAHAMPVVWLANRNALLALFFGLLSLMAHDQWRRKGRWAGALLSIPCLALTVLSAEIGVAVGAYLLAYAFFLEDGSWRRRLVGLLPLAAVLGTWWFIYRYMGYGVWGSGYYIDPGREPLRFAMAVAERGPILLWGQLAWISPIPYSMLSASARHIFWAAGLLTILSIGLILIPLVRRDRVARFWAMGMVLAVVPICAKAATDGATLVFVGLGAMGLVAQFIGGLLDESAWLSADRAWRAVAWTLCILLMGLHIFRAPIQLVVAATISDPAGVAVERFTNIGSLLHGARRDVVIVNAPSSVSFFYLQGARDPGDESVPAHIRTLAPGYSPIEMTRLDSRTVAVRPQNGYFAPPGGGERQDSLPPFHFMYAIERMETLSRSEALPTTLGERIDLTGMSVEMTATTRDGRLAEATVRFAQPLDDSALVWLRWDWNKWAYVPFRPPAVGRTVRIPGPPFFRFVDILRNYGRLEGWQEAEVSP